MVGRLPRRCRLGVDRKAYLPEPEDHRDQLDAATIYSILETEILPLYYARNKKGYSEGWVKTIKNSIAQIAPHYTMKRQLDDYYSKFYNKLAKRFSALSANDNAKAKEIAAWKEEVVLSGTASRSYLMTSVKNCCRATIESGKEYTITYVIDEKGERCNRSGTGNYLHDR